MLVKVTAGAVTLEGDLTLPEPARGIVLFAHGSGSSRLSPRNRYVARMLNEGRLATLLVDLLTGEEEESDAWSGRLVVIPGASHLFEEPGALEQVAALARQWFDLHLAHASGPDGRVAA